MGTFAYHTLGINEIHSVDGEGRPYKHRTIQILRARIDGLDRIPLKYFDLDVVGIEVIRAGRSDDEINTVDIESDIPADPTYEIYVRAPMRQIAKRIQFEPPALPEKIWWFRGSDPFLNRIEPPLEWRMTLNETNFYFHEFYDVEGELCGVAWRWKD